MESQKVLIAFGLTALAGLSTGLVAGMMVMALSLLLFVR
jgi:hypothetical protein